MKVRDDEDTWGGALGCWIDGWIGISDVFCPGVGIWNGTGIRMRWG